MTERTYLKHFMSGFVLILLSLLLQKQAISAHISGPHKKPPVQSHGSPNPTAWWTFDEGSGSTASDSSGNGHTGMLKGSAGWTTGLVGAHASSLPGSSGCYVDVPAAVIDTTKSFTVMAWVNLNKISGYQTFLSIDGVNVSGFYLQFRDDSRKFSFGRFASDSTSASEIRVDSPNTPGIGEWHHLAGVYDSSANTISLYVDGYLAGSTAFTTPWIASGHTEMARGLYFTGNQTDWVQGSIDDARIYSSALTAAQISAIVQPNLPPAVLTANAGQPSITISPILYGLMTEELNHCYDGGLYGELIQNRNMMISSSSPSNYSVVTSGNGAASISLDSSQPLNTASTQSLKLNVNSASSGNRAGFANDGYWGIPITPNTSYQASFYAKTSSGTAGPLTVDIESSNGSTIYASAIVSTVTSTWQKYSVTLTTGTVTASGSGQFVVSTVQPGVIWFDMVSLFAPTYNNRVNGNRPDLMNLMKSLNPSFLRLPGGNNLEGETTATRYIWENTIGDVSLRPGHQGTWGYFNDDGLGLTDYLNWCDDLSMQPLLAVFAGYSLNGYANPNPYVITGTALQPYVTDAVNEVQYVSGAASTTYGAERAANGHAAPETLNYVEVGNEDWFDQTNSYDGRFTQFYDALKAAYPAIKVIATTTVTSRTPDLYDQHFYWSPAQFEQDWHWFDGQSRSGPKIFIGEWASQEGAPTPDLNSALGDGAWLIGLERNSDLVVMESYAPMMANVNSYQWQTNLIGLNNLTSYGSPSYYVQQMFSQNHGDVLLPTALNTSPLIYDASKSSSTGTVYVKVVNAQSTSITVNIQLQGTTGTMSPTGTALVLSSANVTDTNSISSPVNIVPQTNALSGLTTSFNYMFTPYSVTVLILPFNLVVQRTISGTVSLQACLNLVQPITFILSPTTGSPITKTVTLGSDGSFQLTSIPAGTYTLGAKGASWLRKDIAVNTTNGNVSGVALSLLAGDINGDNRVDASDFTAIRAAFGSTASSSNWNANADINRDGQVSLADLAIMRTNFGKTGDP